MIFFINSKNALNGNPQNFTVNISNNKDFFNLEDDEILTIKPVSFAAMNDFFNIYELNNKMDINVYDSGGNLTDTILIELNNGYYNVYNFQETLEAEMELQLNNNIALGDFTVSIVFNDLFSTYTINVVNADFYAAGNILKLNFNNINTTLAQFVGFTEGEYEGVNIANGEKFTSVKPVNFQFQTEILCKCSLVNNNVENGGNNIINSNLFFNFVQDVGKNEIMFKQFEEGMFKTNCLPLSTFTLEFVDALNRPVLFKNDISLSLEINKEKKFNKNLVIIKENVNEIMNLQKLQTLTIS